MYLSQGPVFAGGAGLLLWGAIALASGSTGAIKLDKT